MSCRKPTPQLPTTQLCRCGAWSSRPTFAWELAMLPKSRCPVAQVRLFGLTFLYRLSSCLNLLSDRLRKLKLSSARSHTDILTNAQRRWPDSIMPRFAGLCLEKIVNRTAILSTRVGCSQRMDPASLLLGVVEFLHPAAAL